MTKPTASSPLINGRYQLLEQIGEGGMGIVCRAFDRLTGDLVALKQIHLSNRFQLIDSRLPNSSVNEFRMALAHEFQILAGLRHPNVISVLDYGFDEEKQPFFTMTYLTESETILAAAKRANFEAKIDFIRQLLQALAYLHRRGVLHRDLKPDNVLVQGGVVRVLDFGLSDRGDLIEGSSAGTPLYMAPENFEQQIYLPQSDLYAAGILATQMLTGAHPFEPFDFKFAERVLTQEPNLDGVDAGIRPLLSKLLQKEPENRPADANDALKLLSDLTDGSLQAESPEIRESYLQAAQFVGREAEMGQLTAALSQNRSGIWLVGGESGVGKSRLLRELRTRALVDGWQVFIGQEIPAGKPLQLWETIVPRLALGAELTPFEISVLKEIDPTLDALLGQAVDPAEPFSGSAQLQRISTAMTAVLQRQTRPTLLLLEDLHWSQESLYPIQHFQKVLDAIPSLIVVGTYRSEERPGLTQELPGATPLMLERLSDDAVLQLSQAVLGGAVATPQLVSMLNQETEGNTFFIVEVIRRWAESVGHLSQIDQAELPADVLTSGMENLLLRRLQRVTAEDRPLLDLVAVAGRQIDRNLLMHWGPDIDREAWLQRISETTILNLLENQWMFDHDKLRQAILSQIESNRLKALHRRVAEGIEASYPGDEGYNARLLNHWREAGDVEKELMYIEPVANHLIRIPGDYDQAEHLLKRGLELATSEDHQKVSLLNALSYLLRLVGRFDQGFEIAHNAMTISMKIEDEVGLGTSLVDLGLMTLYQGKYAESKEYLQQGLAVRQALGDPAKIAVCFNMLGINAAYQGDLDTAQDCFEKSLAMHREAGDRMRIADGLANLGQIHSMNGKHAINLDYTLQSVEIRKAFGEQDGLARDYVNLCSTSRVLGDYTAAREYIDQAGEIWQSLGNRYGMGIYHSMLGMLHYFTQAYDKAVTHHQDSLALRTELGGMVEIADNHIYIALSQAELGHSDLALRSCTAYFELCEEMGSTTYAPMGYLAVGQTLVKLGNLDRLDADAQTQLDYISHHTELDPAPIPYFEAAISAAADKVVQLNIWVAFGRYFMKTGAMDDATSRLEEARRLASEMELGHRVDEIDALIRQIQAVLPVPSQPEAEPRERLRGEPLLAHLLGISRRMATMRSVAPLLSYAMDEVIALVGAERGYIVLMGDHQTLEFRVRRRADGSDIQSDADMISRSILDEVVHTQASLVVRNAIMDPRFGGAHSVMAMQLRSIMCAPLITQDRMIGAIYVESRSKSGRFSKEDLAPLEFFSNQAAVAIENAKLNDNLEELVDARTQELAKAKDAAENANELKSKFLSNMSHELRTPLNSIINFSGFVVDGVYGEINDEQFESLQQVLDSGEHLLSLINDILDLNKIEAGMSNLMVEPVDLIKLLKQVLSTARGLIKEKEIDLRTDFSSDMMTVHGDRRRLRQIFLNLISNAVKYTIEGEILVRVVESTDRIEIAVHDTGIGINPEDARFVFEPYRQARHNLENVVSTGLGLPITKQLVEMHHGQIWFESESGIGSIFTVTFPKGNGAE